MCIVAKMTDLSEHDTAVLNSVLYPNLPLSDSVDGGRLQDFEEDSPEVVQTRKMEMEAIKLAEEGKLDDALEILNQAVHIAPQRASIYNNRAHVYQFKKMFTEALNDLDKAVALATDSHKKTLSQALCQRGIIHRRAARFELAKENFEIAARMGNQFAKSQLVEMNPYAALCNQMLRKVMDNV